MVGLDGPVYVQRVRRRGVQGAGGRAARQRDRPGRAGHRATVVETGRRLSVSHHRTDGRLHRSARRPTRSAHISGVGSNVRHGVRA